MQAEAEQHQAVLLDGQGATLRQRLVGRGIAGRIDVGLERHDARCCGDRASQRHEVLKALAAELGSVVRTMDARKPAPVETPVT